MKLFESIELFCKTAVRKKFFGEAGNPLDRFMLDGGKLKCSVCGGLHEGAQNAVNHWNEQHKGKAKKKAA